LAKKKVEKPRRELTRRQHSRRQQQKKRQRIIFGSGILIIVAVLAVVGAGVYNQWYVPEYKPLHETVIEVNDTKFDMSYYIKMLKIYTGGTSTQLYNWAGWVVTAIEQNELIRQEAAKLGYSVSDEEVKEQLNSNNPPLTEDYTDVIRAQLLLSKLKDEYFDQQVPTYAKQRHIWAMFLESESQANDVRARLEAGEDFAALAAELSLDTTCKAKEGDLGWRPEGVLSALIESPVLEENAFNCEVGVLSQPIYEETKTKAVGYWLIEVESRDVEAKTATVKVMLLASEQQANGVRARLEAGEDFATLATEFSQHSASKDNGGEFEVTSTDTVSSAFDDFVFDPEVALQTLSQPIRDEDISTTGGYWLIKITEADDNRQIDDENRNLLKADALNQWAAGLLDNPENKVVSYLDDEKMLWAISHVLGG
jgi:parvulin-like peptidyl-prolyl isomerase